MEGEHQKLFPDCVIVLKRTSRRTSPFSQFVCYSQLGTKHLYEEACFSHHGSGGVRDLAFLQHLSWYLQGEPLLIAPAASVELTLLARG